MIAIDRIDGEGVPAAALGAYACVVAAVGSVRFGDVLSRSLRSGPPVDRLYVIEDKAPADPLVIDVEADKPSVSGADYVRRFLPADPLRAAIGMAAEEGAVLRLRVTPGDIVVPSYRAMLERAGIVERVSFVRRSGRSWRCMTVARRRPAGPFGDGELAHLGGLFMLASPLIDRHQVLRREVPERSTVRVAELEERFAQRFPELTQRERQVCARAAIGMSIEGASIDLGIGSASVLTYRKRAYRRLGVGSANELAALVLR